METLEQISERITPIDSSVHWHFRALPLDAQHVAIRRLALRGLPASEISARTGWSVERVRRFISEDECLSMIPMMPVIPSRLARTRIKYPAN
jgi:hypothetical protein